MERTPASSAGASGAGRSRRRSHPAFTIHPRMVPPSPRRTAAPLHPGGTTPALWMDGPWQATGTSISRSSTGAVKRRRSRKRPAPLPVPSMRIRWIGRNRNGGHPPSRRMIFPGSHVFVSLKPVVPPERCPALPRPPTGAAGSPNPSASSGHTASPRWSPLPLGGRPPEPIGIGREHRVVDGRDGGVRTRPGRRRGPAWNEVPRIGSKALGPCSAGAAARTGSGPSLLPAAGARATAGA